MERLLALVVISTLGACQMSDASPPSNSPPTGTPRSDVPTGSTAPGHRGGRAPIERGDCNAQDYVHLVGQRVPQSLDADGPVRIFSTGQPVTMDYNPQRLNIELHPQTRRVVAVTCG